MHDQATDDRPALYKCLQPHAYMFMYAPRPFTLLYQVWVAIDGDYHNSISIPDHPIEKLIFIEVSSCQLPNKLKDVALILWYVVMQSPMKILTA